jgi:anti-anti-sigma factor
MGHLQVEQFDDVVVVALEGEHDLSTASSLSERLQAFANQGHGVAVDVSEAEFVDLAVVRALLEADEALRAQGRRLALLFGTTYPVKRLLQLTGTQKMFACAEEPAGAIALAGKKNTPRSIR